MTLVFIQTVLKNVAMACSIQNSIKTCKKGSVFWAEIHRYYEEYEVVIFRILDFYRLSDLGCPDFVGTTGLGCCIPSLFAYAISTVIS